MSPELQYGEWYGSEVDIWAFGILMRALLTGYLKAPSPRWMCWSKMPHLPKGLSKPASESLKQLLDRNFDERVKSVDQVKSLPFFYPIRWWKVEGNIKENMKGLGLEVPLSPNSLPGYQSFADHCYRGYRYKSLLEDRESKALELDPNYVELVANPCYDEFEFVSSGWKSRHPIAD